MGTWSGMRVSLRAVVASWTSFLALSHPGKRILFCAVRQGRAGFRKPAFWNPLAGRCTELGSDCSRAQGSAVFIWLLGLHSTYSFLPTSPAWAEVLQLFWRLRCCQVKHPLFQGW